MEQPPGRISIHAPVKGATIPAFLRSMTGRISIHAPVKGATYRHRRRPTTNRYFNPRTREGCDLFDDADAIETFQISIHAPVKGATLVWGNMWCVFFLFQSTHP